MLNTGKNPSSCVALALSTKKQVKFQNLHSKDNNCFGKTSHWNSLRSVKVPVGLTHEKCQLEFNLRFFFFFFSLKPGKTFGLNLINEGTAVLGMQTFNALLYNLKEFLMFCIMHFFIIEK